MGLGLGLGIWWPTQTSIIPGLLKALCARATYCENKLCTTATLEEIAAVRYTPPPPPTGILLVDYPGAAAAYSLRNLIDTTTSVVRVRRSYDNTESNFTATEITDGTLVDFTNQGWFQSAINPFTTFTSNGVSGFDATDDAGFGETFVNVENGVSGDVVNITLDTSSLTGTWTIVLVDASGTVARSNAVLLTSGSNSVALTATGDFAFVDIFCQNPTTSISVTNFSASINVGDDGFVTTWYDQSGSSNDLTQATAINQPILVLNGILQTIKTSPSILINGNQFLVAPTSTRTTLSFAHEAQATSVCVTNFDRNGIWYGTSSAAYGNSSNEGFEIGYGVWNSSMIAVRSNAGTMPLRQNFNGASSDGIFYLQWDSQETTASNRSKAYVNSVLSPYVNTLLGVPYIGNSETSLAFFGKSYGTANPIGNFSEMILWDNIKSTEDRTGIETNINTEYTIY